MTVALIVFLCRRYARFISRASLTPDDSTFLPAIRNLIVHTFQNFQDWDQKIESWQSSVLSDG